MSCKVVIVLLLIVIDVANLISDWFLYHAVSAVEQDLVYGPPEEAIRIALLSFSIIGSLTIPVEIINLILTVRGKGWIDIDLMSAITIWFEDVPQIVINVVIVTCREEEISYFQLVKASIMITGCVIRIIICLVRYCSKSALQELRMIGEDNKSCRHVVYRIFIMLGLIIMFAGSIVVFLFTQSERELDGKLNFKIPNSLWKGEYNDEKYFKNVSMFISHPLFEYNTVSAKSPDGNTNWLRIAAINEVRKGNADRILKIEYDDNTRTKVRVSMTDSDGNLAFRECYTIRRTEETLTFGSNCPPLLLDNDKYSQWIFRFQFQQPDPPRLIFGDINYNVKVKQDGVCHKPVSTITGDITERIDGQTKTIKLHFYRLKEGVSAQNHVLKLSGSSGSFYHHDNLIDIAEVWKTGFGHCKSTGSLAPHRNTKLDVPCI